MLASATASPADIGKIGTQRSIRRYQGTLFWRCPDSNEDVVAVPRRIWLK